jgi:Fe2+ or Zn2+ uptake regulation protein
MNQEQSIRQELKARGFKATPQRLAVLRAVAATNGYFTPQELHRQLSKQRAGIGLVTVYRTLASLAQAGLICQMESTGNTHIYTRSPGKHHHHLVCQQCARVVDFSNCDLSELADRLCRETGFAIQEHSLEFRGLCPDCSLNKTNKTPQPEAAPRE